MLASLLEVLALALVAALVILRVSAKRADRRRDAVWGAAAPDRVKRKRKGGFAAGAGGGTAGCSTASGSDSGGSSDSGGGSSGCSTSSCGGGGCGGGG